MKSKMVSYLILITVFFNSFLSYTWAARVSENEVFEDVNPRVTILDGPIRGVYKTTFKNTTYSSFEGIPFAIPPVGGNRFKDPIAATAWNEELDATEPGPHCLQFDGSVSGNEDCLFIDVYAPVVRHRDDLLPVMVYVHGGGFFSGPVMGRPDNFMDEEVLYVQFHYRLGVLGFLSLGTKDVPGNAGMRDQVLALKWIKNNIKFFGGDPNNISIFGESAGGASVHLLHLSPMTKGLIHKVISMSGTSLCGWAIQDNPQDIARLLAELLNLGPRSIDDASFLKDLQEIKGDDLLTAWVQIKDLYAWDQENQPFSPVVESNFPGKEAFLNKTPAEYYRSGGFDQIPLMIGYSSKEYYFFYDDFTFQSYLMNPLIIVPKKWRYNLTSFNHTHAYNEILKHYFGKKYVDVTTEEGFLNGIDLLGDVVFSRAIKETVGVLAKESRAPVYFFRFSYRGENEYEKMLEPLIMLGATHGEEIDYIFNSEENDDYTINGWVRKRLMRSFTNMAKYGNPTPEPSDYIMPTKWLHATETVNNYMEVNIDFTSSIDPDARRTIFWIDMEKYLFGDLFI